MNAASRKHSKPLQGFQPQPPITALTDPNTGEGTGVGVRVLEDGVFVLDAQGRTLAVLEVTTNTTTGEAELVAYLYDADTSDELGPGWQILRIPASATPATGSPD